MVTSGQPFWSWHLHTQFRVFALSHVLSLLFSQSLHFLIFILSQFYLAKQRLGLSEEVGTLRGDLGASSFRPSTGSLEGRSVPGHEAFCACLAAPLLPQCPQHQHTWHSTLDWGVCLGLSLPVGGKAGGTHKSLEEKERVYMWTQQGRERPTDKPQGSAHPSFSTKPPGAASSRKPSLPASGVHHPFLPSLHPIFTLSSFVTLGTEP